jgi:indolepyruvate ferredoxin oxidoreductase alpha subunit
MIQALKRAVKDDSKGLRVIIADGECALAKQRRIKPLNAKRLKLGKRVVKTKFGVDEDTCSGDHSCIRLSGCPSLTIKENPDPLRVDPVTTVNSSCIGCGNCGEVAHAAVLCPSFYRVETIQNPSFLDSLLHSLRKSFIALMQGRRLANSHEYL